MTHYNDMHQGAMRLGSRDSTDLFMQPHVSEVTMLALHMLPVPQRPPPAPAEDPAAAAAAGPEGPLRPRLETFDMRLSDVNMTKTAMLTQARKVLSA